MVFVVNIFAFIGVALLILVNADVGDYTYWIDPASCGSSDVNLGTFKEKGNVDRNVKAKFDEALKEAQYLAKRTYERMDEISALPTINIAAQHNLDIFEGRFKASWADISIRNHVKDIFKGVASYTQSQLQKQASIRFYCHSDDPSFESRFVKVPDDESLDYNNKKVKDKNITPNSQRKDIDTEYKDTKNGVLSKSSIRNCNRGSNTGRTPAGYTAKVLSLAKEFDDQNKNRATITFCAPWHKYPYSSLAEIKKEEKDMLEAKTVDVLAATRSFQVLHEMLHAFPLKARDVVIKDSQGNAILDAQKNIQVAYKWEKPMWLEQRDALENVDTYAYYALATFLADSKIGFSKGDAAFKRGELRPAPKLKPKSAP